MKSFFMFGSLILIAGAFLSACQGQTESVKKSEFKLIILREDWFKLEMGYKPEKAEQALRAANTDKPLFVAGTGEIEKYDWNLQTITLTKDATDKLIKALSTLENRKVEIDKLKNLEENMNWSNPIERALYIHPFIVKANDEFKYGGIFLDAVSQMAIDFPVIRVTISDGKAVFALLPIHLPFVMLDPIDEAGNVRNAPALREDKTEIVKPKSFDEMNENLAKSEVAVKFRSIIRDPKIKSLMQAEGK